MRNRCNNPNHPKYAIYGGRGISICDEWNDFHNFYNFAITNGYASDLEIDRIDVNGNYEPSNCRFVTDLVQARNTTRCKYEDLDGERLCGSEIAEKYGLRHDEYKHMMYVARKGGSMSEYAQSIAHKSLKSSVGIAEAKRFGGVFGQSE